MFFTAPKLDTKHLMDDVRRDVLEAASLLSKMQENRPSDNNEACLKKVDILGDEIWEAAKGVSEENTETEVHKPTMF